MLNFFEYDGIDSRDFGILIRNKTSYNQFKYTNQYISIPGRDGDIIKSNKKAENIIVEYELIMYANRISGNDRNLALRLAIQDVKEWLIPNSNYKKLTDSYIGADCYYQANFNGDINFQSLDADTVTFTVTFNCKPYKYLFEGENALTYTYSGSPIYVHNNEIAKAYPYIKITGSGDIKLIVANSNTGVFGVEISDVSGYVEVDSEMQNCYKGTSSMNNSFTGKFPILGAGNNAFSAGYGTITQLEIIPRWRRL